AAAAESRTTVRPPPPNRANRPAVPRLAMTQLTAMPDEPAPAVAPAATPASPPSSEPVPPAAEDRIARPSGTLVPLPAKPPHAAASADVALLYSSTGKRLKGLDETHGSAATADLWPLYLRIRINDVIGDPVKCAEADVLLRYLDEQIARRAH